MQVRKRVVMAQTQHGRVGMLSLFRLQKVNYLFKNDHSKYVERAWKCIFYALILLQFYGNTIKAVGSCNTITTNFPVAPGGLYRYFLAEMLNIIKQS